MSQNGKEVVTNKLDVKYKNKENIALAAVAQWFECQPVNQKVKGLIPC